jgi:glutamate/tyrosine decarboxylase-like PLP-dependent enzyme
VKKPLSKKVDNDQCQTMAFIYVHVDACICTYTKIIIYVHVDACICTYTKMRRREKKER